MQIFARRFGAVPRQDAGVLEPDDASPIGGVNGFAVILAVGGFARKANPLLPGARRDKELVNRQNVHAVAADEKAKDPDCDEQNSPKNKEPKKNFDADRITRDATQYFVETTLEQGREALAKKVPCAGRANAGKFGLGQNMGELGASVLRIHDAQIGIALDF